MGERGNLLVKALLVLVILAAANLLAGLAGEPLPDPVVG